MKERELRKIAKCALCRKQFGHEGLPLFWRVKIERYGVDMNAIQRQTGLALMFGGNGAIAAVMGPDEDMAKRIGDATEFTVCEKCAISQEYSIAGLDEFASTAATGKSSDE